MKFTKMQGLGNDYLYVYGKVPENVRELSVRLSNRYFGAGSDGMIYIQPSEKADFSMRIFNADGSEALMCGNGIRCVGKYVYDKGYTDKTELDIETLSGIRHLSLILENGRVKEAEVNMGIACKATELSLNVKDQSFTGSVVYTGNPHTVIFTEDVESIPLEQYGPLIEYDPYFSDRTNVEFVQILGVNHFRMRVFERGSGITMACGTGACASAYAAVVKGYCQYDQPIQADLDGGTLYITVRKDSAVMMRGPAVFVYDAESYDE